MENINELPVAVNIVGETLEVVGDLKNEEVVETKEEKSITEVVGESNVVRTGGVDTNILSIGD